MLHGYFMNFCAYFVVLVLKQLSYYLSHVTTITETVLNSEV